MTRYALAALLMGMAAWGQAPFAACPKPTLCNNTVVGPETPAPLKCGKYQHVETDRIVRDPTAHGYIEGFRIDKTPTCADDMHPLTEKEWQELVEDHARLKSALEHLTKAMERQSKFDDTLIKNTKAK